MTETSETQGRLPKSYVVICRAADSDRGEIDVCVELDGDFEEGGRYERDEYLSALDEARDLAFQHGVQIIDEIARPR